MEMKDFTAQILPDGYYLYFRGKCIGAGKSDEHNGLLTARQEVEKILNGQGFIGFTAAVLCLEGKKKRGKKHEKVNKKM